ncbi:MAPEG family protein [Paraferrimonas sp. SM1919]|uniref:MAPEG family protein n=1 Tax=Paraferrimonas sp. SM1919 TaxID=2662263 RepID=UPI0013D21A58|nr:MAPEG family protein [Paraferrimonas sp. SM1919]
MLLITGLYAAITAIFAILLGLWVANIRGKQKIGVGDKGTLDMIVPMRTHANLIENTSLLFILFACAELSGLGVVWLHLVGVIWLIARPLHAWGMLKGRGRFHIGRFAGTIFSWGCIIALAIANIYLFLK